MKPRIFISAVTAELGATRQLVANVLSRLGYDPVWQDIFGLEPGDLRQMLRDKIDDCDGLIHLVGRAYGAEPPEPDPGFGRVSYTQYELKYAQQIGKKTWIVFAEDGCSRSKPLEQFDLPHDAAHPDPAGYQAERRALQAAWRERLKTDAHLFHAAGSDAELELKVERLRDEFAELRRHFRSWQQRVLLTSAAILVLVGGVLAGQWWLKQDTVEIKEDTQEIKKAVQQLANPAVLAERIRKEIHATAEGKIKALPNEQGRGRLIAEIEKERDIALGRVDDLIKLIQDGLKAGASPVFQRAAEILEQEGTDAALEYLESRRPSTLESVRRHAEQAKLAQARADEEKQQRNQSLQPILLEAELLEAKLQFEAALKLREQAAEFAPDWFEARNMLGLLHLELAHFAVAEPHLRATLKLSANPTEESIALHNLALLFKDTNRLAEAEPLMRRALAIDEQTYGVEHPIVARKLNSLSQLLQATNFLAEAESLGRRALVIVENSLGTEHSEVAFTLNNLATLLQATNRLSEAELLLRRALTIDERSYGAEYPSVAVYLNNLAAVLQATNRLTEADPLMRRALAIDEKSYGVEHPKIARDLNNLAVLLQAMTHLTESEPLMRRALVIDEQSYGAEHPDVARDLNNLAQLLQATNRLPEAEPLMRRALVIDQQSYGGDHPDVANKLNNLALLLKYTNRLTEAESLMRRALEILERSYGAEHASVAIHLNNLALLLMATNRLLEAEPLMRRHVTILHLFGVKTGHEHPQMQAALRNYRILLIRSKKLRLDEIEQRTEAALQPWWPLKPIVPEVERLLGPAESVADVLAALDRQYKADGKPEVYFLSPKQPLAPHLDQLLGRSKLDVPLNEPIAPHLEKLLGPAKSTQEVFDTLDGQYREQNKPAVWFLPLSQPIAPHLDELLGPVPTKDKE